MKKFILYLYVSLALTNLVTTAYPEIQELSEPETLFEHLWQTYDRNYAIFGPKRVDWEALYKIYRPQVTPQTSDEELFTIMSNMLGHLNDNHVRLMTDKKRFTSGILRELKMQDHSLTLIQKKYLKGKFKKKAMKIFTYGWLDDSIGYFHFRAFVNLKESEAAIDEIVHEFKDAKAIIVDIRQNGGGDDRVGKLIADRFADQKRLYMITRIRNGPKHEDFTPPKYWYVDPDGPIQFTKPVILLTHRFSISGADNFTLAMRVLPHVTVIGDFTSGCFADQYGDRLPNGWRFSVSYKLFTDHNGFCWEGIGVPPDIRITNSREDIFQRKQDKVLEFAMKWIHSGPHTPQKEPSSLKNIRESLAKSLEKNIKDKGIKPAIDKFHQSKAGNPDAYYVDAEELLSLGDKLLNENREEEAFEVFKINVQEFPDIFMVYPRLWRIALKRGDKKLANKIYEKAKKINRKSYPWEVTTYYEMIFMQTQNSKGLDAAFKLLKDLKKKHPEEVNENRVNTLGYRLLSANEIKAAIEIFKWNVEAYPESWNVYDSLGEAYMKNGDKKLAIQYYKKSLELNPRNNNAVEMLKKLETKQ